MTVPASGPPLPAAGVQRFTRTERAVHWVQAASFLLLLVSGFVLVLPGFEAVIGQRALLREIHLTAAFAFAFGPAIVALSGDRRSLGRDVEAVDTWDADDLRWLVPFPLLRAFGIATPPQGRFNAGQKLNAIFVVWSTLFFVVTGLVMWQNRRFPGDLVARANSVHTALAYIALVAFLGHLALATLYPPTRHALRAMTGGWVRAEWARRHYPKWTGMPGPAPAPAAGDALRTGIQIVLGSYATLFAVRVGFFALGANVTDKVTARLYAVTAWPGAATIQPHTAVRVADWIGLGYGAACLGAWLIVDRFRAGRDPRD